MKKYNYFLPLDTIVKVVAYHKVTHKEIVKTMTLEEWYKLKKNKIFNYRAFQL